MMILRLLTTSTTEVPPSQQLQALYNITLKCSITHTDETFVAVCSIELLWVSDAGSLSPLRAPSDSEMSIMLCSQNKY